MDATDLADIGAVAGQVSPVEATQAAFRRIAAREPQLNAFVLLDEEGAIAATSGSAAPLAYLVSRYRFYPRGRLPAMIVTSTC